MCFFLAQKSPPRVEQQSKDDDDDVEIIIPDELPALMPSNIQTMASRDQHRTNQDHLKTTKERQNVGTLSDQSLQKRARFTEGQVRVLEQSFKKNSYPKKNEIERLSNWLEMSPKVIGVWFQNARQRAHKVTEDDEDDDVEVILPDAVEAERPLVASMEAERPLVASMEAQRPPEVNRRSLSVRIQPEKTSLGEDSADPYEPGTQFNVLIIFQSFCM